MKKLLLLLLLSLYVKISYNQNYHPFIGNSDKIWDVFSDIDALGDPNLFSTDSIHFISDTIIDSKLYKKISDYYKKHNYYTGWTYNHYFYYIREDSAKKVFIRSDTTDYLLYNFALDTGDFFYTYLDRTDTNNCIKNVWKVSTVDSVLIGSEYRRRITLVCLQNIFPQGDTTTSFGEDYWIEGIGSTWGFLDYLSPGTIGGANDQLSCYFEDGELLYNGNIYYNMQLITQTYFTGDCITTITNTSILDNNTLSVQFKNGILQINTSDNESYMLEIYNYLGQIMLNKSINGSTEVLLNNKISDGVYLFRVNKNNQIVKSGKFCFN